MLGQSPLATAQADIEERKAILISFFTDRLFVNVCRSLFAKHLLLFSFLMSIAILKGDSKVDDGDSWCEHGAGSSGAAPNIGRRWW